MLTRGELSRPIDWFDLFFHGVPWLLLVIKGVVTIVALVKPGSTPAG